MIDIEKAILGCVIIENSLVPTLLGNSDVSLFSGENNQIIYKEIIKLQKKRYPIDTLTLGAGLKGRVSISYISSLLDGIPRSNISRNFIDYLNILKKEKAERDISKEIECQLREPYADLAQIQEIISNANLLDIETETGSADDFFYRLDQGGKKNGGITIGFPTLDKTIGGFKYEEVLLFMARTGAGKTFWALNVLNYLIKHTKENIAFFSLEMPEESIWERIYQIRFSLNREEAREKLRADKKVRSLIIDEFEKVKIYKQNYSLGEIELKIKETRSKIVFIDYLDLIREQSPGNQSRYEKISYFINELKKIAKRQNCLIILLHQLSRKAKEGEEPVKLTMARDSGVVEEASDFVLGAWRPELGYEDKREVPEDVKNRLFIKLLKNKHGSHPKFVCFFDHADNKLNKGTGKILETEWRDSPLDQ